MANDVSLGIYNPQLSDCEDLQRILVKHNQLLAALLATHQQGCSYTLLTGPQGSGKTHLLRLFAKQLAHNPSDRSRYQRVSLDLAPTEFASCLDFLLLLLNQLEAGRDKNPHCTEQQAVQRLLEIHQQSRLIILIEDFDQHLLLLNSNEQQKILNFLKHGIAVFATAEQTPPAKHPLSSVFAQHPLQALNVDEAEQLMVQVAQLQQKPLLAEALTTPKGKICIQALHHLAGGIGRYYVAFVSLLKQDPLLEFNPCMLQMLDALSPIYHGSLQQLATQQQRLFRFICRQQGTISVTDIAEHNHITHQTTSGQLKKLKDKHWVRSTSVGRTAHYEAFEPMKRLSLGLSRHPQSQVLQSIDFICQWFASSTSGYLSRDGHCFIYDKSWLYQQYVPNDIVALPEATALVGQFESALLDADMAALLATVQQLTVLSETANTDEQLATRHLECLYGLCSKALARNQLSIAQQLTNAMFHLVTQSNSNKLWKQLCRWVIGITALFAVAEHIELTLSWLGQLERQESKLGSQAYSISLSHCMISKAKGYALINEYSKAQQALEQLRIRAEKRNNIEIAGAYCHAVKETISFIAISDEKQAAKYLRQVQDMTAKYKLYDLAFACTTRLWARQPQTVQIEQVVKKMDQVRQMDGFNYEIFVILFELAMQPLNIQIAGYVAIWQALAEHQQQNIFAAALNQVSVTLAKNAPKRYDIWLNGCTLLLDNESSLLHSKRLLLAVQQYLTQGLDEYQLLVLPQEERTLVLRRLKTEGSA